MAALAEHILQPGLYDAQVLGMLPSGEPKAVYLFLVASMYHSTIAHRYLLFRDGHHMCPPSDSPLYTA